MDIDGWNERYRQKSRAGEDFEAVPTQLVRSTAGRLEPRRALDLACGTGRNALWLARAGWRVTAVDGSAAAIEMLRSEAERQQLNVQAVAADLLRTSRTTERVPSPRGPFCMGPASCALPAGFRIEEAQWDLVLIAYYLQRDLFEPAKRAVAAGGVLVAIVHTTEQGEEPTESRLRPGELKGYFEGWQIMHEYEGQPHDSAHKRRVAEIVARRRS